VLAKLLHRVVRRDPRRQQRRQRQQREDDQRGERAAIGRPPAPAA